MNFMLTEIGKKMLVGGEFKEGVVVDRIIFEVDRGFLNEMRIKIYGVNERRKIMVMEYEVGSEVGKVEIITEIDGTVKLTLM